ncbi:NAD(P)H-hydrate epimerase [Helicobacter fennelliae]|uniref:NAD(P)H-hydrate epimerase n=1 Tax=Helicobacter fennelliae TaxID=215 RepID=UPI000E06ED16|nr:NAD(P)H-hydrate epimerase [Helicobacter fennelliae]STQ83677.1 Integral membrane protein [Helicobacter fennelliae]
MQNLYKTTNALDKRLLSKFLLHDEILMENVANAMFALIQKITHAQSVITIVCGSGDNGGDGYVLARKLHGSYKVRIYEAKEPKSKLCKIQSERANLCEIERVKKILPCDVIVDCLFGSGFSGEMRVEYIKLIESMNCHSRLRVACDIPSGLDMEGNIAQIAFKADYTISMGALKLALFSDMAKDIVGEVLVGDLGVSRALYEVRTPFFLLEKSDLKLPFRESQNCHKGNFGHLAVIMGEKKGAGILSALAALRMGAGLVSVIGQLDGYPEIMCAQEIPHNANVIAIGMGFGRNFANRANSQKNDEKSGEIHNENNENNGEKQSDIISFNPTYKQISLIDLLGSTCAVIDADLFYASELKDLLIARKDLPNIVLTPHPKEFVSLLEICGIAQISLQEVITQKIELALRFSEMFPNVVLLLKGANPIIAFQSRIYINPLGNSALAKGGSGDVLSGIISAYLAQGFSTLDSALFGSMAHALAARCERASYALTPLRLIEHLGKL